MPGKRLEWKVGIFVLIGLAVVAALMLEFSKGLNFFGETYQLRLHASNLGGGLKRHASVLMSGVQVGNVSDFSLAPDGKSVTVFLNIFKKYNIYPDAVFQIEQSGFLGDQYVAIVPTQNAGRPLADGASVTCEPPMNFQEIARSAGGFIRRVDETVQQLDAIVAEVRRLLLNQETLTNLSVTVENLRVVSERAVVAVNDIEALLATNSPAISQSASNLTLFSVSINRFADSLNGIVETNRVSIAASVSNIESATVELKRMLDDVNAGKGPAGTLLRNEQLAANLSQIANNLSITTSNLNRLGLWRGVLFPRQPPPANEPPSPSHHLVTPKNPYR